VPLIKHHIGEIQNFSLMLVVVGCLMLLGSRSKEGAKGGMGQGGVDARLQRHSYTITIASLSLPSL
jgi:hypothetical protein